MGRTKKAIKALDKTGWVMVCESPLEMEHGDTNSVAKGFAVQEMIHLQGGLLIAEKKLKKLKKLKGEKCKYYKKFDGHYTPQCVNDHGHRLNSKAQPDNFKFCPYCGKSIRVVEIDRGQKAVEYLIT